MKNLTIVGMECISDLNAIGIYPNDIDRFEVNTRANKRWGQARIRDGVYSINISVDLLQDDCPMSALRNTIFHELIHCVDGCMNHGKKWQEIAELVNDCYGTTIKRCSTAEEKVGSEYAKVIRQTRNERYKTFTVKCTHCDNKYVRKGMRAPKWYAHPENFYCLRCGGKIERG